MSTNVASGTDMDRPCGFDMACENYYGFTTPPFQLTPDARFFYSSPGHSRAIAHLTFGLAQPEGFVVVTGDAGVGKTTVVERLWSQLDRAAYTLVRINTTRLSGDELFRLAMAGFGVTTGRADGAADKAAMLLNFEAVLRQHRQAGKRCLLAVDEAQNLSLQALEELRMLSNLTVDGAAVLQTVLLGQPQFRQMLGSPDLAQLRQRVLASYHLGALDEAETQAYVEHRLTAAGWTGQPQISPAAFTALHRHSGGIPRCINRLCTRVLLYGALEQAATVTADMVHDTARELEQDLEGGSTPDGTRAGDPYGPDPAARLPYDDLASRVAALETGRAVLLQLVADALGRRR